jgi:hypothetical protein
MVTNLKIVSNIPAPTVAAENEMQTTTDTINGGWGAVLAGATMSGWNWLTTGANGMTIILTLLSIALAVIKLADAVRTWRATDPRAHLADRIKSTFGTRPAPLDGDRG